MRISDWSSDVCSSDLPEDSGDRPCAPVADTAQAPEDVDAAIAFIRNETGAPSIDLVGWSWGATIAAACAAGGGAVNRLVLHAPQWLRDTPSPLVTPQTMAEPYRTVDIPAFVERRSEEHTSELQSIMRNSYAVFCLK